MLVNFKNKIRNLSDWVLNKSTLTLVIFFTAFDLIGLSLHWLYSEGIIESRFFNLSKDRGFAEIVQYLKYAVIIMVLTTWQRHRLEAVLKAWVLFFVVLLLDDSVGIHEFIGKMILNFYHFTAPFGLKEKDLAEIFGFAMIDGAAYLLVFIKALKSPRDLQRFSLLMSVMLIPVIAAGIILDLLWFPLLEQIAEMVACSLLLIFTLVYYRKKIAWVSASCTSV